LAGCGGGDAEPDVADAADAPADVADGEDDAGGATDAAETATPDYGLVTPDQAAELAASGVTVIDVRTPEEYAEGHLEGARLIDFSAPTFADDVATLDPDGEYLVYCRSGNRSGQAVEVMAQLGFDQVWDMDGGVIAYAQAGLPLVR
jgi:rhodanese-related sulfurtransferase